jgi:hypothetical protein
MRWASRPRARWRWIATGEAVHREPTLPGAVLTRVAASHLRVGTFEYFAARGERERVRRWRTTPSRATTRAAGRRSRTGAGAMAARRRRAAGGAARAVDERRLHPRRDEHRQHEHLRRDHRLRSLRLHGGLRPGTVFSSIDHGGRYAYGNQPAHRALEPGALGRGHPALAGRRRGRGHREGHRDPRRLWRQLSPPLAARACVPSWAAGARRSDTIDTALADDWLALLQAGQADSRWPGAGWPMPPKAGPAPLRELFADAPALEAGCRAGRRAPRPKRGPPRNARRRCGGSIPGSSAQPSRRGGPGRSLTEGDLAPFEDLLKAIQRPFDEDPALARYAEPAPAGYTESYRTFCGT